MIETNIMLLCLTVFVWALLVGWISKTVHDENKRLKVEAFQAELDYCKLEKMHEVVVGRGKNTLAELDKLRGVMG